MAYSARLLVLAAALAALALTTATTLAGRDARARADRTEVQAQAAASERSVAVDGPPISGEGLDPPPGARLRVEPAPRPQTTAPPRKPRAAPDPAPARDKPPPKSPPATVLRVKPGRSVAVRARPGGEVIGRLDSKTRFGSPQTLAATKVRGRWLGVASSARTDGGLGWVDGESAALRAAPAKVSISADLSEREVELRRGDRVIARAPVAVGRPGSRTPTGRFSITDKLNGRRLSPYYGCCVLALSGTQPNLPVGWSGGNRLAIHGTNDPSSIGTASSAGCLRAGESDLKQLMRRVPLGTPVQIRY